MQILNEENKNTNAENTAKIFKYYLQFKNPYLKFIISFNRVSSKSFYMNHKRAFDSLTILFQKYKLDLTTYIRFFIEILDKRENNIDSELVSNKTISDYIDWLKNNKKQEQIYKYFLKSANNIAHDAIKLGYYTTKDFIRYLIANKKMAEYFITGKISVYYFAAIPSFKNIIPKLDSFAKAEFQKMYDRFDVYNAEITTAFLKFKNQKVNPIRFTDELIFNIRDHKSV